LIVEISELFSEQGREYTKHACRIHGKEFVGHAKEDYTTKASSISQHIHIPPP